MGRIKLHRMRFHTCHGALPHEQHVAQEFWVDVTFDVDIGKAAMGDRLEDTVDYGEVARVVEEIMMGPPAKLLERLAVEIHQAVHELDDRIGAVEVRVTKVNPPIGVPSGGVEVIHWDGD